MSFSVSETKAGHSEISCFNSLLHIDSESRQEEFIKRLSWAAERNIPFDQALEDFNPGNWSRISFMGKASWPEFLDDLRSGKTLRFSLKRLKHSLPNYLIKSIAVAETQGTLHKVLPLIQQRINSKTKIFLSVQDCLRRHLFSFGITMALIFGIMLFIVPSFFKIFNELTGEYSAFKILPLNILKQAHNIVDSVDFMLGIIAFLLCIGFLLKSAGKLKNHWNIINFFYNIPVFNSVIHYLAVYEFSQIVLCALSLGKDMPQAIQMGYDYHGCFWFKRKLKGILKKSNPGERWDKQLARAKILNPFEAWILHNSACREKPIEGFQALQASTEEELNRQINTLRIKLDVAATLLRSFFDCFRCHKRRVGALGCSLYYYRSDMIDAQKKTQVEPANNATQKVNDLLLNAVKQGASDIYFLPLKNKHEIRYRVNGIQQKIETLDSELGVQCVTRLKVMGSMLTYRTMIAQDGAIRNHEVFGKVEFRVAIMPTVHGERATVRLLDGGRMGKELKELNFQAETLDALRQLLPNSSGMIVLTGPTGSGKTSTIYAMIRELLEVHQDPASIITIEDPVECELPEVSQVNLSRKDAEWNYAEALKSALRQDVKTLVIGELRDREVAKVALEAAFTGHRVITTFHAGDIPSVYARLLHMGFEPFLIAGAIRGVVSQRLVQKTDGSGRVPAAAVLQSDDSWRDFITGTPDLSGIREHVKTYPQGCLESVLNKLSDENIIAPEVVAGQL
ncbi:MAG: Flp pilus assembly complex ATPase component [Lentisphaerae bacterium]|nr:Flp pilus assembly complex ATPase component [Lentisphaerota bacterium]MCP4101646.1 Flp pilus assembly complex ATPase component [Lentisphaerota bacterium]